VAHFSVENPAQFWVEINNKGRIVGQKRPLPNRPLGDFTEFRGSK
jgi:hypothetical protein